MTEKFLVLSVTRHLTAVGSSPGWVTCETGQCLLGGGQVVFLGGSPILAPSNDWLGSKWVKHFWRPIKLKQSILPVCAGGLLHLIWAASSEFVSSSIPSWQTLTAHAQPFRGARDLAFCLKVPLDSLLVWASSEGSGETARMRRLAWTFAARIGYKYQIRLTRSIWSMFKNEILGKTNYNASFLSFNNDLRIQHIWVLRNTRKMLNSLVIFWNQLLAVASRINRQDDHIKYMFSIIAVVMCLCS